jgi:hypothetical protein
MNLKICELVLETCKTIMRMSVDFRNNLVKQITDFAAGPEFRSGDIVSSIPIFLAQLYTLLQIDKIKVGDELQAPIELSKKNLQRVFRFAFEEEHRRSLAKLGKEALNDEQILDFLFPQWKVWLDTVILDKQTDLNTEIMGQLMSGAEEAMQPFEALATKFRNYDTGVEKAPEELP